MGKRGTKPKPTYLKIASGNPGKRKLNHDEPQPEMGIPDCPEHIESNEVRKEMWDWLVEQLKSMKVISKADRLAMEIISIEYARMIDNEKILEKEGDVIPTTNGNLIQSPYLGVANQAKKKMKELMTELGLTPSSRTSLVVGPSSGGMDLDMYLDNKNRRRKDRVKNGSG